MTTKKVPVRKDENIVKIGIQLEDSSKTSELVSLDQREPLPCEYFIPNCKNYVKLSTTTPSLESIDNCGFAQIGQGVYGTASSLLGAFLFHN